MLDETTPLPDDPDDLRDLASRLIAEVKAQAILIEKLRHQLAGHRAHRFGASAETSEQLQLALETSELAAAVMTAKLRLPDSEGTTKDKPKRRPIPDHVPRMEVELSPAADDCAACGGALRRIGEDVTEELEYVPGRFVVNRIVRPRFACRGCERFTQSPLPSRPIERGRPGPGLLAHVLVSKYGDHLPLYRQSQILERDGIDLDRSTLAEWVGKSTALLEPLTDAIGRHVMDGAAIHADDTPVRMLAPGTGKTQTARLWTYVRDERPWNGDGPSAALYRFSPDRKGIHPARHLAGFRGWMHADGYAGFEELYRGGAIREVARHRPTSGASSSTSTARRARPSPRRPSRGSAPSRCREGDPGLTARRARPHPASRGRTRLRRPRGLARRSVAQPVGQDAARGRDPLRADPHGQAQAVPRSRGAERRQQPGRARHARRGLGAEELALRRLGRRREGRRRCRDPGRDRQAE